MTTTIAGMTRESRASVLLMARIDGRDQPYRVMNLSKRGLCVSNASELQAGEVVSVSIGLVEGVQAEVVWVRGDLAGLRFAKPIDQEAARKRPPNLQQLPPSVGWTTRIRNAYGR